MATIKKRLATLYNWCYDRFLDIQLLFRWRKDLQLQKTLGLPQIMSICETLEVIKENSLSVCRYGDGEFKIMDGEEIFFQLQNSSLSQRLKEVIQSKENNLLVCLPTFLDRRHGILPRVKGTKEEWRRCLNAQKYLDDILARKRRKWYGYLDLNREYGNALITRCYVSESDSDASIYFSIWKTIFIGRKVLIIEGEKTRFGVGNDLLSGCVSVRRILCPARNAYDVYDRILQTVLDLHNEKELCLIALGPAATVLAYDLSIYGIQAIDIGHLDIEYEWFTRGDRTHKRIEGKFVSEAKDGDQVEEVRDNIYQEQIIFCISNNEEHI